MKRPCAELLFCMVLAHTLGCSPDAGPNTASREEDVETATNGSSYVGGIHDVCRKGDLEALKKLLKGNRDLVNSQDNLNGMTPLHHSADTRQDNVTEYLIAKGANVKLRTKYGETALHLAAFRLNAKAVRLLLDAGAEINAQIYTSSKGTPLEYALDGRANLIHQRSIPPEAIWNYVPKTPEQLRAEDEELKQVLELLKARGAKRASELMEE